MVLPYCSKCGVEVDYGIEKCHLCDFSIPKIETDNEYDIDRYPDALNPYPEKLKRLKKSVFCILTTIIFSNFIINIFIDWMKEGKFTWSYISGVSIITAWVYLFVFFGYAKTFNRSLNIVSGATLGLLFFIDLFTDGLKWFFSIGVPAVLSATIIIWMISKIISNGNKKFLRISAYILIGASLYCMILELFIELYVNRRIELTWSVITAFEMVPLAVVLFYLDYGVPQKYKDKLKKKFHL